MDPTTQGAFDYLKGMLASWGLDSPDLISLAQNAATNNLDATVFVQQVRQSPTYQARFPAMATRQKNGAPAITEQQYMDYETQAKNIMRTAGLPAGFYDSPDDFANLIGADLSPAELQTRISDAATASAEFMNANPDVKATAAAWGLDAGKLTAFWLDPNKSEPMLKQQSLAMQVGGAARQSGFGQLSEAEATRVSQYASPSEAGKAFQTLAQGQQVTQQLVGEAAPGMTSEEQLNYASGQEAAQLELQQRAQQRAAQGQAGGGFAGTSSGVTGLAKPGQ